MSQSNPNDQNHVFPEPEAQSDQDNSQNQNYQNEESEASDQDGITENLYFTNPITTQKPNSTTNYNPNSQYNPNFESPYFQEETPEVQIAQNKDIAAKAPKKPNKIIDYLTKKWWLVLLIMAGISLITSAVFFFINRGPSYDSNAFTNVSARVEAPVTSPSGSPALWKIIIQNKENINIQNLELNLEFDRSFQYARAINPDPIDPRGNQYKFSSLAGLGLGTSELIIQFEGILTGNIDEETLMRGTLTYTPEPLIGRDNNTRTVSVQSSITKITAPNISVTLSSTQQTVQNGGEVELLASFENQSDRDLRNMRITMFYPSGNGFEYKSSELQIKNADVKTAPDDGNNVWNIPTLPRLQTQTLRIKGNVFGSDGVRQQFRIEISTDGGNNNYKSLAVDALDIQVTAQPLIVSTRIENKESLRVFEPGETLNFVVDYQNRSTTTLQNVEIFALIDDPANLLDYNSINFVGGDIANINNRVIQWRGSGVPQLNTVTPQVRGSLRFSIKVKEGNNFIQSNLNQNTYTLRPKVQAKANNLPSFEVAGELYKARGELSFNETVERLPRESGPANQEIYKITWEIRTRQSNVKDIIVESVTSLPTSSWKQTSIAPADAAGELVYNPQTGTIVWTVGSQPGYLGYSGPVKRIQFNLVVEDGNRELVGIKNVQGVDEFTGEKYEFEVRQANR
jgi:hypothetical protein